MNTTSVSLLGRLRQTDNHDAWRRFVQLYSPLLYYWARGVRLPAADAADLVQEVLLVVVEKMPQFAYNPDRSFRGWLRTITLNKWRKRCRRHAASPAVDDKGLDGAAASDTADTLAENEYRHWLVRQALEIMQSEFEPTTWKACLESVVSGRPAAEVAAELNVRVEVVYGAKSRVLRRLREELDGLLE